MAHLHRLIAPLLIALAWFVCASPAHAALEITNPVWIGQAGVAFSAADPACQSRFNAMNLSANYNIAAWTKTGGQKPTESGNCNATHKTYATNYVFSPQGSQCPTASPPWTANTTAGRCERVVTTCTPPLVENPTTHICEPPPCPKPGTEIGGVSVWEVPSISTTACVGGCVVQGVMSGARGGRYFIWGPFTTTGSSCSGTGNGGGTGPAVPSTPAPPSPPATPPGNCPGTVNGAAVTVPCDTTNTPGPITNNTPAAPGTTPAPSPTPPPAGTDSPAGPGGVPIPAPGGSTTSSETTCTGSTCTTTETTTTTDEQGNTSTSGTATQQTKEEFCASHPGSAQCKAEEEDDDPSTFAGSCEATACTGDAIQCAMAREQARRWCQVMDTPNDLSTLGESAMNGNPHPDGHPRNEVQDTAVNLAAMLDATPVFGSSGQCPNDVPFSVQGRSFTLPFSMLCPYLQMLGAAFLASCYLGAAFIVFRKG